MTAPGWLGQDSLRLVLALWDRVVHDEGVEATPPHPSEAHVTTPGKIKTCPDCGQTGTIGVLFYPSNPSRCKACTISKINAHITEVNEQTRSHAENHRQPWSELEVEMLLGAIGEGMHAKDVAEMLGRTYRSVHAKLSAVRKLLERGLDVNYVVFEVTSTTTTTATVRQVPPVCGTCHLVKPCFCD